MKLKLDTVLTVVLIAYFILHYGLAPRVTPYYLFAIIFAGLIIFGFLDTLKLKESVYEKFKKSHCLYNDGNNYRVFLARFECK